MGATICPMKPVESRVCTKCPEAESPNWGLEGEKGLTIVAVLESSDHRANRTNYENELFLTRSGRAVAEVLGENIENTVITNAAKCLFQHGFKKPGSQAYKNCAENVQLQIREIQPQVIICFGEKAAEAVTGQKFSEVVGKILGNVVIVHHPRVMTIKEKRMIMQLLSLSDEP